MQLFRLYRSSRRRPEEACPVASTVMVWTVQAELGNVVATVLVRHMALHLSLDLWGSLWDGVYVSVRVVVRETSRRIGPIGARFSAVPRGSRRGLPRPEQITGDIFRDRDDAKGL